MWKKHLHSSFMVANAPHKSVKAIHNLQYWLQKYLLQYYFPPMQWTFLHFWLGCSVIIFTSVATQYYDATSQQILLHQVLTFVHSHEVLHYREIRHTHVYVGLCVCVLISMYLHLQTQRHVRLRESECARREYHKLTPMWSTCNM